MTDNVRGSLGPPWSVDLLADLHAGVLDEAESERLWPQVNADPEARAILDALDSVQEGLGQLGTAPVEPMPARFAARLDAALADEAQARWPSNPAATAPQQQPPTAPPPTAPPPTAPVVDLAAARKRRNRMAAWGAGVLTAAAAAAAIAFVALPGDTTGGSPSAGEGGSSAEAPVALSNDNLNEAIGLLNGKEDYGALENERGLRACLDQNDIAAADVVGVSPVTLDGQEAVGALLGAGEPGQAGRFRLVVLTADCEPLAETLLPS